MPSPESDRRSVPLDLFSTALISGIDVAKSYRPDLPGAFGGGNVNIRTKLYPSKTIYKLKVVRVLSFAFSFYYYFLKIIMILE